jgi:hypothetical protein
VSAEDIAKLTQVDFERDAAFVAVHAGGHGAEEIIGLRSNTPMLGFVKRAGFTVQPVRGDATVRSAVKDL